MRPLSLGLLVSFTALACSSGPHLPRSTENVQRASPLGESYVLNPLPGEDDSLLGRVLIEAPNGGHSLEEVARPNPCGDKLGEMKTSPTVGTFEDAEELSAGGAASAALGTFGFEADASYATHFVYKLETTKREARIDTNEYVQCCKEKGGCGYGFVSALVYGDGEYATAEEATATAGANVVITNVSGTAALKILHSRKVHGFIAALITVTDPSKKVGGAGLIGDIGVKLDEQTLEGQAKERFEADKATIEGDYNFAIGLKAVTENEFVRRYHKTTGSEDLDDVNHGRRTGDIVISSVVMLASTALFGFGLYRCATVNDCKGSGGGPDVLALTTMSLGLSGLVASITFFAISLSNNDGTVSEHELSKPDAELYVAKYNRSLLKKAIRDSQDLMKKTSSNAPSVRFVFGGTGVSLVGAF